MKDHLGLITVQFFVKKWSQTNNQVIRLESIPRVWTTTIIGFCYAEKGYKKKIWTMEQYRFAMQELVYDKYEGHGNDIDPDLAIGIPSSLKN